MVGAGPAGLTVASLLAAAGVEVLCCEARRRTGGRLLSLPVGEGALDLGSTWYWPGEERVARLVASAGIATFRQYRGGDVLEDRPGGPVRIPGDRIDVPAFRYARGAQSVAHALAALLPPHVLHLDTPVVAVESAGDGMTLTTQSGPVRADQVVVAVPPALAVATIAFTPGLPERLDRLARLTPVWMAETTKVVVRYPHPFWRAEGLSGTAFSLDGPLREIHDLSGPTGRPAALFGFARRPQGSPPIHDRRVTEQLIRLYGPAAGDPLQLATHDWALERYTSPVGTPSSDAYQLFGHPLYAEPVFEGRLHWASTETAHEAAGHVEGALAGAERAVAAVLDRRRRHRASGARGT